MAATPEEREQAKQEAELSVAPRLLTQVTALLAGRLVSGDALYCQKALCRQIRAAGGDDLFAVKGNHPSLLDDVTLLFREPPPGETFGQAQTLDLRRGRREVRAVRTSGALATYLRVAGWADAGLVLEVTATVGWIQHPAKPGRKEVRYFLTSLPADTRPTVA